ncbi:Ion transport domain-containing protein [Hirschfeldia incana]|nr:Ion transport domain-containing protein [Hirschfeldia incana]
MASPNEKDEFPMLPISDLSSSRTTRPFRSRCRSVSLSNTHATIKGCDSSTVVLGCTGPLVQMSDPLSSTRTPEPLFLLPPPPSTGASSGSLGVSSSQPERYRSFAAPEHKNSGLQDANFLRSGQLEMCNDPYYANCLSYYRGEAAKIPTSRVSAIFDSMVRVGHSLYADAKGWARRFATSVNKCISVIKTRRCPKVFASWLVIFIDPLFFFLIKVKENEKCIVIDWPMAKAFVAVRSVTDVLFSLNILLQLVKHPRRNIRHYLRGMFLLDLFIVMPLPQIWIFWILPTHLGASGDNYANNFLKAAVLFQYIPKLCRLLPLLAGKTPTVFLVESACSFVVNILTFILVGHVVGSCWYLFGMQRVNHCLRDACGNSHRACRELIYCGPGNSDAALSAWKDNASAIACFQEGGFSYGVYLKAVNLTSHSSLFTRYIYSLFWGFQQISTLAGNQVPGYFLGEVFFTMGIIGLGLLLFPLLISNMQNFLQALGRRNLEMSHKRFLEGIRGRVRLAAWVNWAATGGFNEKILIENMPNDLQRDRRRQLLIFLKEVRIFSTMDESILDAIRERLTHRRYISSSMVLHRGDLVEQMVFIVRGEMESFGEDGIVLRLSEGEVCGEELLTWCLGRSFVNPDGTRTRVPWKGLLSNRNVRCVTDVEAFSLSVADIEDITTLFLRFLKSHKVQGATKSPYWMLRAARQIQVPWRHRRRRLQRFYSAQSSYRL